MDSAIEFHNCDSEEAKVACCVFYLAQFYKVSPESMAHCCNMARLIKAKDVDTSNKTDRPASTDKG